MTQRTRTADWPCSIARAIDELGDGWTLLLVRDASLGARRFDDFQRSLGIGRNILTDTMAAWADRWMAGPEGSPLVLRHTECDHDMHAEVVCSECGERLEKRNVRARQGPGHPAAAAGR
jgi:DNA-binding HxlR family transcriptional regulator